MVLNNVLVAFGGISPEHEVSVLTAIQAMEALKETEYRCVPLYISKHGQWFTGEVLTDLKNFKDLNQLTRNATPCTFSFDENGRAILLETEFSLFKKPKKALIDAVLMAFHGADGENGSFQGVCEVFNLPYTGSPVAGAAVGMDKRMAKEICRAHDIPVVDDIWFSENDWVNNSEEIIQKAKKIGFPLFVKPAHLGSSIGVKKTNTVDDLEKAIETGFRYDNILLVEKGVSPLTEINCSVLGTYDEQKVSVCERPLGSEELLSFEDKYMSSGGGKGMASASRIIPADISDELTAAIQDTARNVFRVLGGSGLARLDFLVDKNNNQLYFNEINTIPGSFSFYLWDKSGLTFPELLKELISIAKKENQRKNGRVRSHETNLLNEKAATGIKGLKGK